MHSTTLPGREGSWMHRLATDLCPRKGVERNYFSEGAAITLLLVWSAAPTSSRAQDPVPPAVAAVRGAVTDPDAKPIGAVTIVALSTGDQALTDSLGGFGLSRLPVGNNAFFVKRLGFQSHSFSLVLPADSIVSIAVRLWPIASTLPDVVTTEKMSPRLHAVGFEERKARFKGLFITRAEIAARPSTLVSDHLRGVPRVSLRTFGLEERSLTQARIARWSS